MSGLSFENVSFEGSKQQVSEPGIYEAALIGIEVKDITNRDGNVVMEHAVQFSFELKNGTIYTHTEMPPKEASKNTTIGEYTADQQKALTSAYSRFGHILKKYVAPEKFAIKEIPATATWEQFVAKLQPALDEAVSVGKEKSVWLKIQGSTYNGKAYLGFSRYLGFIGSDAKDVQFGKKEIEDNANYAQFIANKAAMAADPLGAALPSSQAAAPAGMNFQENPPF